MTWQYKVLSFSKLSFDTAALEKELNSLSEGGWRFLGVGGMNVILGRFDNASSACDQEKAGLADETPSPIPQDKEAKEAAECVKSKTSHVEDLMAQLNADFGGEKPRTAPPTLELYRIGGTLPGDPPITITTKTLEAIVDSLRKYPNVRDIWTDGVSVYVDRYVDGPLETQPPCGEYSKRRTPCSKPQPKLQPKPQPRSCWSSMTSAEADGVLKALFDSLTNLKR